VTTATRSRWTDTDQFPDPDQRKVQQTIQTFGGSVFELYFLEVFSDVIDVRRSGTKLCFLLKGGTSEKSTLEAFGGLRRRTLFLANIVSNLKAFGG
jgi:hypothetical protein